ncbi:hypothetical protein RBA63_02615, partial [Brenneria goodwinii]
NHFKLILLWGGFSEHGGQSVFCTDLIRSKSWPAGQDFVNSLKGPCGPLLFLDVPHQYCRLLLSRLNNVIES